MLEVFRQKGIEVLLLTDPIDEYSFQKLKDYNDHKLIFITKKNCEIDETEDEKAVFETRKGKFEKIGGIVKGIIGEDCEKVTVSKRLVITTCVILTGEHGWYSKLSTTDEYASFEGYVNVYIHATKENTRNQSYASSCYVNC
jgi:molecular chaperone HtpG